MPVKPHDSFAKSGRQRQGGNSKTQVCIQVRGVSEKMVIYPLDISVESVTGQAVYTFYTLSY